MHNNKEDIWKSAVGNLIFFCTPAPRSLPGEWAVNAGTRYNSALNESRKGINANMRSLRQTICFIHSPNQTLSPISAWIYVFVSFERRIKFFPYMTFPLTLKVP